MKLVSSSRHRIAGLGERPGQKTRYAAGTVGMPSLPAARLRRARIRCNLGWYPEERMFTWQPERALAELDETRLPFAVILGGLWLAVLLVNALYMLPKLASRSLDGPSPLPVVGSLFGLVALLIVPVATLPLRLLALPLALLPDLLWIAVSWLVGWMERREAKRPPGDRAP